MTGEAIWNYHSDLQASTLENCPDLLDLAAYVDENMTPSERNALELHLSRCDRCLDHVMALGGAYNVSKPMVQQEISSDKQTSAAIPTVTVNNSKWKPIQQIAAGVFFVLISLSGYRIGTDTYETNDQILQFFLDVEMDRLSTIFENTTDLQIGGSS